MDLQQVSDWVQYIYIALPVLKIRILDTKDDCLTELPVTNQLASL